MLKSILRSLGLKIENENHAPVLTNMTRPQIENNLESLGAEYTGGGGHIIDWDDDNDPLRRAILGRGPKRPFGK
jgi:hypothetical protein